MKTIIEQLRFGEPQDVMAILESDTPIDTFRLQAALMNATENIALLKAEIRAMKRAANASTEDDSPPWE